MKKLLDGWLGKKGTMRSRLIISFSVPVLAVMVVVLICAYGILFSGSKFQALSSARSSYNQAYELVSSYVDMMLYVSDSIYYNSDLQRILGDPKYTQEKPMDDRYREFLTLDSVFSMAEEMDAIYRAGIYVQEEIPYTNNMVHILPSSALPDLPEGMTSQQVFLPPVRLPTPGEGESVRAVTLLRPVRTTDGSARQICVAQVSVEAEAFEQALLNAKNTEGAFVYLVDENCRQIASTDDERYQWLEQEELLPVSKEDADWAVMSVGERKYYVLRRVILGPQWTLGAMIPVEDVSAQSLYVTAVMAVLAVLVLSAVVFVAIMLSRSYTTRLKNLNELIQQVRSGELEVAPSREESEDEISKLFNSFSEMTAELQNLMRAQFRSGKAVKSAELRALQAQINPHFLYNTLDLINWEAFEHDAPEISEIVQNLAKFYRLSLNKGRQILTVREELEHVRAYVSIENCHFDGAICLQVHVPEKLQELACLNIILQPFVENAILHGFGENPSRGVCNIQIDAWEENGDLVFQVWDDGPGMTEAQVQEVFRKNTAKKASGYGVKNIHSRIQLCFGTAYGVTYCNLAEPGTTVLIRIPALTPEEAEKRLENP